MEGRKKKLNDENFETICYQLRVQNPALRDRKTKSVKRDENI